MNMLLAMAPMSCIIAFVFGMGVDPSFVGNELPSIWFEKRKNI